MDKHPKNYTLAINMAMGNPLEMQVSIGRSSWMGDWLSLAMLDYWRVSRWSSQVLKKNTWNALKKCKVIGDHHPTCGMERNVGMGPHARCIQRVHVEVVTPSEMDVCINKCSSKKARVMCTHIYICIYIYMYIYICVYIYIYVLLILLCGYDLNIYINI